MTLGELWTLRVDPWCFFWIWQWLSILCITVSFWARSRERISVLLYYTSVSTFGRAGFRRRYWETAAQQLGLSILSSVLFKIYMKWLDEVFSRFAVQCRKYADDIKFYLSLISDTEEAMETLNWCLITITGWMRSNKLNLNFDKTDVLLVSPEPNLGSQIVPMFVALLLKP